MSLFDAVHRALMAGLGMQEKLKEFIEDLVKKGELSENQGAKLIKEWSDKAGTTRDEFEKSLKELISAAVERINFPTRKEVEELSGKVDALSKKVKKLEAKTSAKESPEKS
jgi:polyhydroxyalkanoate synthesis regulator phasin